MKLNPAQRWSVYAVGLAVAIGAAVWVERQDDDAAVVPGAGADMATPTAPGSPTDAAQHAAFAIDGLPARKYGGTNDDPFSPRSWKQMAAREAARNAPRPRPPAPQPPPLPFSYLGKLIEGKETTVFLTNNDRNYVARVGETIDSTYRVEEIGEHDMVLTYLPLKRRQEMAFETDVLPAASSVASRARRLSEEDDDPVEQSSVDVAARPSLVDREPPAEATLEDDE